MTTTNVKQDQEVFFSFARTLLAMNETEDYGPGT